MDRRPPAYQPSSATELEDSASGQNVSAGKRHTANRASKHWYDAATASPFAQFRYRRLACMDSSNISPESDVFSGRSSEPTTSRLANCEPFSSSEESRAVSTEVEYSVQKLRSQYNSKNSFSRAHITSAHITPEAQSIDDTSTRHQDFMSSSAVLPKKRHLPVTALGEDFSVHSKYQRSNRNEERVSYEHVNKSIHSPYYSYSPDDLSYGQQVSGDPMAVTSVLTGESISLGKSNQIHNNFARSHYNTNSEDRSITGSYDFNTSSHTQNCGYDIKRSETTRERLQESINHWSGSDVHKGIFTAPSSNMHSFSRDLLPQSSSICTSSGGINSHHGNEFRPFSGLAFNTSENTFVNLPQREQPSSLQSSELCKRDNVEGELVNSRKLHNYVGNDGNSTLVLASAEYGNAKLNCDTYNPSHFSVPYNSHNFSRSTNVSSYGVSPISLQSSIERNTPLNFSSHAFSKSKFEMGKLSGSSSMVNNEFHDKSDSSQSLLKSSISETHTNLDSSFELKIQEKLIKRQHKHKKDEIRSFATGDSISTEKNVDSMSGLSDRIMDGTLSKHHLLKEKMKIKCSTSDGSKTLKPVESSRRRRRRAIGLVCGVCGDSARSLHFGGVSCDSCKAFFRRAVIAKAYPSFLCVTTGLSPQIETKVQKQEIGTKTETDKRLDDGCDLQGTKIDRCIPSTYGKHKPVLSRKELLKSIMDSTNGGRLKQCPPITVTTRKYCQSCRFQKCIDIGMEISWVTLESDINRRVPEHDNKSNESRDSMLKHGESAELGDDRRRVAAEKDPDNYLTKSEQRQIENLVDIYRSVFWGVPEPVYYRPALVDFPPPFSVEDVSVIREKPQRKVTDTSGEVNDNSSSNETSMSWKNLESKNISSNGVDSKSMNSPSTETRNTGPLEAESGLYKKTSQSFDLDVDSHTNPQIPSYILEKSQLTSAEIEYVRNLPLDRLGVNMYRKALHRRPRPWLIRQLMGYTLRFMHIVVKVLHGVGRSLSVSDRTILLRQGMTRLTFLNSVIMYDTSIEAWPERIFPSLPLVLQDGESGFISEQHEYLHGVAMHPDEVATVVAPEVLEHQLVFIRGIKALVGSDFPSMFLLMAIMLFDSTEEGLEQPKIVEQIQSNYCYLLKQYLRWKFHDGPPPNPGDERPANFNDSPRTIGNKNGSSDSHSSHSNDPNNPNNEKSSKFTFEKQEGYYFSPPYPPSPSSSKVIYPLLLTKLADLQQTAHNYSSTPFTLHGAEVDEIDNLVARIQVFMCDILTSGPSSINDNDDGSGDSGGMGGDMSFQEKDRDREEVSRNNKGNSFGENYGGKADGFGKELQNKLSESDELAWIVSSGQDLSWDSCSSKDDDEYSGSSLSVMSMGESIDDIVGALITSDGDKNEIHCENEENIVKSLEFWDDKEFLKLSADGGGESLVSEELGSFGEKELAYKDHAPKDKTDVPFKDYDEGIYGSMGGEILPSKIPSVNSDNLTLYSMNSTSKGFIKDNFDPHIELPSQIDPKANSQNYFSEMKFLEKGDSENPYQRIETPGMDAVTKENASSSYQNDTLGGASKCSYNAEMLPGANVDAKDKSKTPSNRGFWDYLKATGKAILGFGSSHTDSKSENNLFQPMTSLQEEKDLDSILEHVERPESNSSGYVSSPSPLSMLKDFEPFHSGADWEDLFQRL